MREQYERGSKRGSGADNNGIPPDVRRVAVQVARVEGIEAEVLNVNAHCAWTEVFGEPASERKAASAC